MTRLRAALSRPIVLIARRLAGAEPEPAGPRSGIPEWLTDHMETMVRDGGRWVADNGPHRSEKEPSDADRMEWRWGIGRHSITGRLVGMMDGRETETFWEYRLFRDPGAGLRLAPARALMARRSVRGPARSAGPRGS